MGYVRCRQNRLKQRRYTAVYRDVRGVERSAGTFSRRARAERAWKVAEAAVADGRYLDVDQGRRRFADYASETWLPQYAGEDTTVQGYDFILEKYLIPEFGATRMIEVTPGRVRSFYALLRDAGLGRATIEKCKTVLSSLFNTAVNDRVIGHHPCHGVESPTAVQAPLKILTPAEYARLHAHLRDEHARLMVDVLIESGCRWGEFAELRAGDLDPLACTLTVARTVIEMRPKYVPEGERGFRVKQYPKNRHWRTVAISPNLADRLSAHLSGRGRDALMFPAPGRQTRQDSAASEPQVEPETFKVAGRSFTHGTLYAYTTGSCRCEQCREAIAAYRAARRGQGQDRPPKTAVPQLVRESRHMRRDWFRTRILQPAVQAAALDWRPRAHDLRHASASWALAGGATVQQVREHLGHLSLRAVERYLHNLPGTETAAATAIARVKATGTLYPTITPSYTPVPLTPMPTTLNAATPAPAPAPHAVSHSSPTVPALTRELAAAPVPESAEQHCEAQQPLAPVAITAAAVSQPPEAPVAQGNPLARSTDQPTSAFPERTIDSNSESHLDSLGIGPQPTAEPVALPENPVDRFSPARRHYTQPHQRSKTKHHSQATRNHPIHAQDQYNGDRRTTDTMTTAPRGGSAHSTGRDANRGQRVERPSPKTSATMPASADESAQATGEPPQTTIATTSNRQANQPSCATEQHSAGSDPLTKDGQTIKKPVPQKLETGFDVQ